MQSYFVSFYAPTVVKLWDIKELRGDFESFKAAVLQGVNKSGKGVRFLVQTIMALPAPLRDESDEEYLNKCTDTIHSSKTVPAVFSRIGFNWDYLNPNIYIQSQ